MVHPDEVQCVNDGRAAKAKISCELCQEFFPSYGEHCDMLVFRADTIETFRYICNFIYLCAKIWLEGGRC
jgi:hypothetical protein